MADHSSIEWTDTTWNPVVGCTKVSPGCDHCYAERIVERFKGKGAFATVQRSEEKLFLPFRWRRPRRVFVNSMSDLFHDDVPDGFIAHVFSVMARTPQHTYQLLTKRHARMRALLNSDAFWTAVNVAQGVSSKLAHLVEPERPIPNLWLGVSVEDQKWADIRIPALLETPAAVRWLSCEPLLGPVYLGRWLWTECAACGGIGEQWVAPSLAVACHCAGGYELTGALSWVVVGGESGPDARPMHPLWARSLRDQCAVGRVPFFFKQWGEYGQLPRARPDGRYANDPGVTVTDDGTVYQPGELAWPDGPRWGEAMRAGHDKAHLTAMYRVGKKVAGRTLDGRTWDEYPSVPEAVS